MAKKVEGKHLPKAGFKSITVTEFVYDKMYEEYSTVKDELKLKGVNSFSAYITQILVERMNRIVP